MFEKLKFLFRFIFLFVFSIHGYSEQIEKVYGELRNVLFEMNISRNENLSDGAILVTSAVSLDGSDFYIEKREEDQPKSWVCPHCASLNTTHIGWGCRKCGWPWDDKP